MKTKLFLENNKILDYINKYKMLKDGDRVVVGLSGGPDSVCLLFVLLELKKVFNLSLLACHVHHGIRGKEADRDEDFCRKLCEENGVEYSASYVDAPQKAKLDGVSLEEAARILRYDVLYGIKADKIAIAHNADDCAETVLFNMCRGTGIHGLRGVVPVRDKIIRPLLQVKKDTILRFLKDAGISYVFDSTNSEQDYSRNRIRGSVIPQLGMVNSSAVENICAMSERLSEVCLYFDEKVDDFLLNHQKEDGIDTKELLKLDEYIQKLVIKRYLSLFMPMAKDVSEVHILAVLDALTNSETGGERYIDLPHGVRATIGQEKLFCGNMSAPKYLVDMRDFVRPMDEDIPTNLYTKWFDYDKIKGNVEIRTRRSGDYIIVNSVGGKKSLKDYMIDAKIPRHLRDSIMLACVESKVLWVFGYRIGEDTKVDSNTKHILEISIRESKERT